MKYFLHDSNALQDEKIAELYIKFGYEGTGLFFAILEKLSMQEKPIKTVVLKRQLDVGKKLEKVWSFMESIGLISSDNGDTFNLRIISYVKLYDKTREKNRERQAQHRENQDVPKNVTRDSGVSHDPNSMVDNSNTNTTASTDASESSVEELFEQFWDLYDNKIDRKKSLAKWRKLKSSDHQAILINVPEYVKVKRNIDYPKNPLTYLNGECWKDPLVASTRQADPLDRFVV